MQLPAESVKGQHPMGMGGVGPNWRGRVWAWKEGGVLRQGRGPQAGITGPLAALLAVHASAFRESADWQRVGQEGG